MENTIENQQCQNCRFWRFENRKGRCKRYPPSVKSGPTNRIDMWEFPEVTSDEWCGEWQPDDFGVGNKKSEAIYNPTRNFDDVEEDESDEVYNPSRNFDLD